MLTPSVEPALPMADRVLVQKGERKLQLLRNGEVLRTYKIALGLRPEGHKEYEGDFRTPEGVYHLSRRNPNSEYFLSIQIDYPNEPRLKRARRLGQRPGRRDHDPRPAERAAQAARLLQQRRLDRRLHRRVELRHGRNLAHDPTGHADRDQTVSAHSNDARASASVTQLEAEGLVDARVSPLGSLENLSQREVQQLLSSGHGGVYEMFRRCALAVLASGLESDDVRAIFDRYKDFEIRLGRQAWGVKLEMKNAPSSAFVDGSMIRGIKEHLFAVLRDIVYIHDAILGTSRFDLTDSASITNAVYHILRNARILDYRGKPDLVVCWGGHSIGSTEYDYTKRVGYEIGLRALSVCTGCGPGAMKGR
jgi:hypothetical protein